MIETGFEEIRTRAPWPAEAGEKDAVNGDKEDDKDEDGKGKKQARPETVRFQGMRAAYFCVDRESTPENLILNRIVGLKEDPGKD